MRYVLFFWAMPLGLFWGWYVLSFYDINFGYLFLSRVLHDAVFDVYGKLLGVEPDSVPGLLVKACVFDTALIGAILAWRRRIPIVAQMRTVRDRYFPRSSGSEFTAAPEDGREHPAG